GEDLVVAAGEGAEAVVGGERLVGAGEGGGATGAQGQGAADYVELDVGAVDLGAGVEGGEGIPAGLEVDGATIVGVDHREAPELVALVDVGDTGGGEFGEGRADDGALARRGEAGDGSVDRGVE